MYFCLVLRARVQRVAVQVELEYTRVLPLLLAMHFLVTAGTERPRALQELRGQECQQYLILSGGLGPYS